MKIQSPAQQTGATVHFAFGKEICRVVYETCADSGGCSQEQFVDFSQYLVCPSDEEAQLPHRSEL